MAGPAPLVCAGPSATDAPQGPKSPKRHFVPSVLFDETNGGRGIGMGTQTQPDARAEGHLRGFL